MNNFYTCSSHIKTNRKSNQKKEKLIIYTMLVCQCNIYNVFFFKKRGEWQSSFGFYSTAVQILKQKMISLQKFPNATSVESKIYLKKETNLFNNVRSIKSYFPFYLRTSIFLYTHHIINVIYFILWKKSLVHLITFLTYFFTDTNKYWLVHYLAN